MTENPCRKSGCEGYCCTNVRLEVTKHERGRLFPKAKRRRTMSDLNAEKEEGVFYTGVRRKKFGNVSGMEEARIIGRCPNLNGNSDCNKHGERSHAARNLEFGSEECNTIRGEHGLPTIRRRR